jgi:hypothetical protein
MIEDGKVPHESILDLPSSILAGLLSLVLSVVKNFPASWQDDDAV